MLKPLILEFVRRKGVHIPIVRDPSVARLVNYAQNPAPESHAVVLARASLTDPDGTDAKTDPFTATKKKLRSVVKWVASDHTTSIFGDMVIVQNLLIILGKMMDSYLWINSTT